VTVRHYCLNSIAADLIVILLGSIVIDESPTVNVILFNALRLIKPVPSSADKLIWS
jgi:hypothetical protein